MLAVLPRAAPGMWASPPESICNLGTADVSREFRVRGRYFLHAHGVVLTDPSCPDRMLALSNTSELGRFRHQVDPEGERFGIPMGAGTYSDIELYGQLVKDGVFAVRSVSAFDRHDIVDRRWRVDSIENGVGESGWLADEQFPLTMNQRILRTSTNETTVYGTLGDAEVGALLKLSDAASGTMCKVSDNAQSMVRLQCTWLAHARDLRRWVYAREGKAWRLVAKTDGVRL